MSPEEIEIANTKFPETPYEVAKAIPEVVHRYFAAALGFFIVCIYALTFRYKEVSANIRNLSLFLLVWVILQGAFGYLTVSLKLLPQIVTMHLMAGFLTVGMLWLLYFNVKDTSLAGRDNWSFTSKTKNLLNAGLVLSLIHI